MGRAIHLEPGVSVAIVTIDDPDSPVNAISRRLAGELKQVLDEIDGIDEIEAVVIRSGKQQVFVAGADLGEIASIAKAGDAEALSKDAQALFDRIASDTRPFVAAIGGAALGGGLELALACHGRVVTDSPAAVLALPEVGLGLIPGAGGTQRLPRLIGLEQALPMLLTGKRIRPRRAIEIGLVDRVVDPDDLLSSAIALARALARDSAGKKIGWTPASWSPQLRTAAHSRSSHLRHKIGFSAPFRPLLIRRARREVAAKTGGAYPAPVAILDAVETGLAKGFRAGQRAESAAFGELVVSEGAKQLIRLFELTTRRKKKIEAPRPVSRLGIVGAGLMGEGIASVSIDRVPVVIGDVSSGALEKASRRIRDSLDRRMRSGAISRDEASERTARLTTVASTDSFAGCDLVIEAAFEDLALKRSIFSELERTVDPRAILASNTSAIPIARISAGMNHPERIIGMHYFSPVPKMPLLEIVAPTAADPDVVESARAFGIVQGKTVIVVGDGPGFYTTRILSPYLYETVLLLGEGADPAGIDRAIRSFGFPLGPVTLLDEVGLDVAAHVARDLGEAFAHRGFEPSSALEEAVESGRLGRKNGRGFFKYRNGRRGDLDPSILTAMGFGSRRKMEDDEIVERLVLAMVAEALRCLADGILRSEEDGDLGAVLGLGFPPFLGGPFAWVAAQGRARLDARLGSLADRYGERFAPPADG
ncbi:MAG: 3-hydroxyacyl-CoA dehydrogenase NAD-binding domain-containing protein [Thermoanaerobaculia bacterium]